MENDQVEQRACSRCRAPVGAQARFCEECGEPQGAVSGRSCRGCGASLGPGARFCAECGASAAGARGPDVRAGWDRFQTRLAATDWARVGRVALPAAALLLAGLVGYALGERGERPAASGEPVVSAARGYRAETSLPAQAADRTAEGTPMTGEPASEALPAAPAEPAVETTAKPTRFRDFEITASSWELAHPPAHAADGDPYTFWHAWKTEKFPTGEWLTLTFPEERVITRIGLLPGRMGGGAKAEGRVRSLLVKAGDMTPQKLIFEDRAAVQYRDLEQPVRTKKLILRIATVLPGSETGHIVVPEVQAWGYPASSQVARHTGS